MNLEKNQIFGSLIRKKVVVTGASGFIGSHLIRMMQSLNIEIMGIDNRPQKLACNSPFRQIDCKDLGSLSKLFDEFKPEVVVHLAARTDLRGRKIADYADNVLGSKNVIELSSNLRLIAASTRLVFNPHVMEPSDPFSYSPNSWYGESKVVMENLMVGLPNAIIVRPTSIWGPNCGEPFYGLIRNIRRGTYLQSRNREIIKTLGYVKNTAYQIISLIALVESPKTPINLGDGNFDMIRFCNSLANELQVRQPKNLNFKAIEIVSRIGTMLNRFGMEVPLTHERLMNIYNSQTYSLKRIQEIVPSLPFNFQDSLREFALWGRNI